MVGCMECPAADNGQSSYEKSNGVSWLRSWLGAAAHWKLEEDLSHVRRLDVFSVC